MPNPSKWRIERGYMDEDGQPNVAQRKTQRRVWMSCGVHLTVMTGLATKWGEPPLVAVTIPIGDHS